MNRDRESVSISWRLSAIRSLACHSYWALDREPWGPPLIGRSIGRKSVMSVYMDRVEVVAAKLGDDAGVLGATAWARQELERK